MLGQISNFISIIFATLTGMYIIKKILNTNDKVFTVKNVSYCIILLTGVFIFENNSVTKTIYIFMVNLLSYKYIFKRPFYETVILTQYIMIVTFLSDLVTLVFYSGIIDVNKIKTLWYMMILIDITSNLLSIIINDIKIINEFLHQKLKKLTDDKYIVEILFALIFLFALCIISKRIYVSYFNDKVIITEIFSTIVFFILILVYIKERVDFNNKMLEYNTMFKYLTDFEEWIEKDQLKRHEYKNQLAVLRGLSSEKKIKDKIDEILEDNIKLEGDTVSSLKQIPKGGIKGLMYYKTAVAIKNNIDLQLSVCLESKTKLNKLNAEEIKIICELIGIYYDNAIEAAKETRKKALIFEIYEYKDKISITISNSFKKNKNFKYRNKKGVSSKGIGHGNGLYFANKLINKNKFLKSKQEVIDKFYVEELTIYK